MCFVSLSLISVAAAADSIPIEFGQTLSGTIDQGGQTQNYTFPAQSGDIVQVRIARSYDPNTNVNAAFWLYAPNGTIIGDSNRDYSELLTNLQDAGTYTVVVGSTSTQEARSFSLYIQRINDPTGFEIAESGRTITATIDIPAEKDTYRFTAQAGDGIIIRMQGSWESSQLPWNGCLIEVFGPDGSLVAQSPINAWNAPKGDVHIQAPVSGEYIILAASSERSIGQAVLTGSYSLVFQNSGTPGSAVPLIFGSTNSGEVNQTHGMFKAYTFTAESGDIVLARIAKNSSVIDITWPKFWMYAPNGSVIGDSTGEYSELLITLQEAGSYTLIVGSSSPTAEIPYNLFVQRVNNPTGFEDVESGSTISANITNPGEIDTYRITAQAGGGLLIKMQGSWDDNGYSNGCLVQVYGPDGTLLAKSFHDDHFKVPIGDVFLQVPVSGQYTIFATGSGRADSPYYTPPSGNYSIIFLNTRPQPLTIGWPIQGFTSSEIWPTYYLDAPSGEDLLVQVKPVPSTSQLEIYGALNYSPNATAFEYVQKDKNSNGTYDLLISPTNEGRYYFGVLTNQEQANFTIKATLGDKYISAINPSTVTNNQIMPVCIYGLGFTPGMAVALQKNGSQIISAQSVFLSAPTMLVASFDFTGVPIDTYDLKVQWPDGTQFTLPRSLNVSQFPEGVIYEVRDLHVEPNIPRTYLINVPETANLFLSLRKVVNPSDPRHIWNWNGKITLIKNGTEIASSSSYADILLQQENPEPGMYTVMITADSPGNGILEVRTALPELPQEEWVVETVYHNMGSYFSQIEVPAGQDKITFEAQIINTGYFKVYRDIYGGSQAWTQSLSNPVVLTIPTPQPGLYIVEYVDNGEVITVNDQERDIMIRASMTEHLEPNPTYIPKIRWISPTKGGNSGTVTMSIRGYGLQKLGSDAKVSLIREGFEPINALSVKNSDVKSLLATFNLVNQTPGQYSIVIDHPDYQSITAPVPFIIEEGGNGDFSVEIVGRDTIRSTWSPYIIKYENRGNVDIPAPLLSLAIDPSYLVNVITGPSSATPYHMIQECLFSGYNICLPTMYTLDKPLTFLASGPRANPLVLPAGSSNSIQIFILPLSGAPRTLSVSSLSKGSLFTPSASTSEIDAASPAPGIPLVFGRYYPGRQSSYVGAFGNGWAHSYDTRLEYLSTPAIAVKNGEGYGTIFIENIPGSYSTMEGNDNLTYNADGTYVLRKPDGTLLTFRSDLLLGSISDPNGNRLTLSYNSEKNPLTISHSNGDCLTFSYNANKRISQLTDATGHVTQYSYDNTGMYLETVITPDGSVTRYTYNLFSDASSLSSVTYPDGITQNFRYDGDGRFTESSLNSNKKAVPLSYNEEERLTTVMDATGTFVRVKVNENGQIVRSENTAGQSQQFTYDQNEDLVQATDPLGNNYEMAYDANHNIVNITDPLGHEIEMTYHTQFKNALNSVTDPRGNTMSFTYDTKGNMVRITYPDSRSKSKGYDSQGNIIQTTTRNGDVINYQYNPRGQLTMIDYPDNSFVSYTYDANGNLLTATNSDGSITLEYNTQNLPKKILFPDGNSFVYSYDIAGRLTQRTEKDGYSTIYAYDELGNLVTVTDGNMSVIARYSYDAAGKLKRKDIRNGGYTTYEYNSIGLISSLVNYNTTGNVLSQFEYKYAANGNLLTIDALEGLYQYDYDKIGKLVSVTYPDGNITRYTYDTAGNRASVSDKWVTRTYLTNNMNQYESAGDVSFTYDTEGNVISKTEGGITTSYAYNHDNRLTSVTSPFGTQEYTYDALGNRVGVIVNGTETRYAVDPLGIGNVVAEYSANGTLNARYTQGLGLVSKIDQSGNEYEYYFNHIGHTTEITDYSGNVVNQYQYTPFGEYRQKIEGIPNPFTYVGEYGVMDDGNGLQYMRMRYFSREFGRFLSEDPEFIPGSNLNSYCNNNPLIYTDPQGLSIIYYLVKYPGWTNALARWGVIKSCGGSGGMPPGLPFFPTKEGFLLYLYEQSIIYVGDTLFEDLNTPERPHFQPVNDGNSARYGGGNIRMSWCGARGFQPINKAWQSNAYTQNPANPSTRVNKPITVVASYDPEDKYGPTGYDPIGTPSISRNRYITDLSPFNYRIDFWNAETATANACDVDAYDQMDSDLNWSSFRFTEVGFTNWSIPLEPTQYFNVYVDTRPSMEYIVRIEGIYDTTNGRANITYHTLDATTLKTPDDPVAGFLPPISDSGKEIGWFAYTISPKSGLSTGTSIDNQAFINFDYSQFMPAPKDAPWHNTIDTGAPSTIVSATLTNQTEIQFTLSGSDDAGGSGIKDFTIYGSDNGGPYSPILNHVTGTKATISGIPDHTYRFYSIAQDNVGNVESAKSQPEVTIYIPVPVIAPSAWFTASPNKGTAPLTVNFNDRSDNNPTEWDWNFGDGTPWVNGSANTVAHTYTGIGKYPVILVASNTAGKDRMQQEIEVTGASGPIADFTATPDFGKVPLDVQFNDTSTGSPTSWNWSFGDNSEWFNTTLPEERNATHQYVLPGEYEAQLIVMNSIGSSSTLKIITVESAGMGPVALFTATPIAGAAPLFVQFNDTSTGGVISWNWSFGDGSDWFNTTLPEKRNATHIFDNPGTYEAMLLVQNYEGGSIAFETVTVSSSPPVNHPPVLDDIGPKEAIIDHLLQFTISASDPDGDDLTNTTSTLPLGANFDDKTGEFTWTPTTQQTGSFEVTFSVSDGELSDSEVVTITVSTVSQPLTIISVNANPVSVNEGSPVELSVTYSDPDSTGPHGITWDFGDGTTGSGDTVMHTYADNKDYTGTVTVTNSLGASDSESILVKVNNVAPNPGAIVVPIEPNAISKSINVNAPFTDPGTLDTFTAIWTWDDGITTEVNIPAGSTSVTGTHKYSSPGIYTISLEVTDKDGGKNNAEATSFVVVYDPSGGFVTGGGWINSPAGAYPQNPLLSGKATFGFVSKYQKGKTVPTGNTEFQFHVANLSFHSENYDWLVIAGPKAQYKGNGTINNGGMYGFMLTAIDGDIKGGGGLDKFRIKIWNMTAGDEIVYDNKMDAPDDADPTTSVAEGSIVIHK